MLAEAGMWIGALPPIVTVVSLALFAVSALVMTIHRTRG